MKLTYSLFLLLAVVFEFLLVPHLSVAGGTQSGLANSSDRMPDMMSEVVMDAMDPNEGFEIVENPNVKKWSQELLNLVCAVSTESGASEMGDDALKAVADLLAKGADVNVRETLEGKTLLMIAAETGEVDLFQLLLTFKADISLKSHNGSTLQFFAGKNQQILQKLSPYLWKRYRALMAKESEVSDV